MKFPSIENSHEFNVPLVSVCVSTFQHVDYIEQCLDSILKQEVGFDVEILVGDDASTDGTAEKCRRYQAKFPDRIRLYENPKNNKSLHLGRYQGRANQLTIYGRARGKYLAICDGDDYWIDPRKLSKQVEIMENDPKISFCITDTQIDNDSLGRPMGLPDTDRRFEPNELKHVYYLGHISSWMLRNEMRLLIQNPIVDKAMPMDMILFNFYKDRGETFYLHECTSCYRYNPQGIFRSQKGKGQAKSRFYYHWLLFSYFHQSPILLMKAWGYSIKRLLKA